MAPDPEDPPGIVRVRAPNPSPLTLDGTNTYVAGGWVVDPGPADDVHLEAILSAAGGEIEGVVLTHDHFDHSEGATPLARIAGGVPVVRPAEGEAVGPFRALSTPGHAPDHVCLLLGRACFTGDTVLGEGSVFIQPDEGSLSSYLDSLWRLRGLDLELLCPGHGPYVRDPDAKLAEYIDHRLERERRLTQALDAGARTEDELLDHAWSDAPEHLRPAAALTLRAHLEKLEEEGRLPEGVERLCHDRSVAFAGVISTNQLKNGTHIEVDGQVFKVVEFQHVKPGKGPAFVRTKLKRQSDGNVLDKTFRAGEKFRPIRTETRRMQYLYADGTDAHFMDAETYEQMTIPEDSVKDSLRWVKPSEEIELLYVDEKPSDVQVPSAVEMAVTETEPGLRGDTASGGGDKPAVLESGVTVRVPLFVDVGDRVRVDTRSGDYVSRA